MFRIFIFAFIIVFVFILAYKIITHMLNSHAQKRAFKQQNPNKVWKSIYKPVGIIFACIFAIITNHLIVDAQYLLAFFSTLFIGGSILLYRQC